VPEAPAEIEEALRRELRKRRSTPRVGLWLSLAACLALTAAWALFASRRPAAPAEVPSTLAAARPVEPAAPAPLRSAPARAAAEPRSPGRRPKEPAVVVEASQAELLAEFGRRAWATPMAASAPARPESNAAEAPAYRGEWKEVAGVWPVVQMVEPMNGREGR
jgi:hypothetical protein